MRWVGLIRLLILSGHILFKWHEVRCVSKNGHHEHMCLKESRLRAQYLLTIMSSILNIIWGILHDNLYKKVSLHIANNISTVHPL